MTLLRRLLVLVLALVALLGAAAPAAAHMGHERFTLNGRKRPDQPRQGPRGHAVVATRGPVELVREGELLKGSFVLENDGDGPLEIYRVTFDPDEEIPRAPAGLLVGSAEREARPLAPKEKRTYTVTWRTDQTLATQVAGFVQIDSDSAAPGADTFDEPIRIGVEADRRPAWQRHLLSICALGPLLLCLLALAARVVRGLSERLLARAAAGLAGLLVPLSFLPVTGFVRVLTREDGAFGFQHVERLAGFRLAVDGLSVAFVPIVPLALFGALSATRSPRIGQGRLVGLAGLAATGASLFVVSQDLLLSLAALGACCVALAALLLAGARRSGARLGPSASGVVALLAGFGGFAWFAHVLAHTATPSLALDGTRPPLAVDVAELMRHAASHTLLPAGAPTLFGQPLGAGLTWILWGAAALLVGLAPVHGWRGRLSRDHDPGVVALIAALTSCVAGYMLLRFGLGVLWESQRALANGLLVWGALITLAAAWLARLERDIRALIDHLGSAVFGVALVAIATMTAQGFQAGLILLVSLPLALALSQLLAGRLVSWSGEGDVLRQSGVARAAPRLALSWLVGALVLGPIGPATLGVFLAVVATIGRAPAQAALLVGLLAALALGVARLLQPLAGSAPSWWRESDALVAHGGTLPDLDRREIVWAGVLVIALLLLLVAPRFWIGGSARSILDLWLPLEAPGPTQVS